MRSVLLVCCGMLLIAGATLWLVPEAASAAGFNRSFVYQGFRVTVSEGEGEALASGSYTITVKSPQGQTTSARATRNGTVIDAWVSDLDRNGRLEVAVITQSAGRDLSGDMALFEWSGSELRARPVADLSPAEKQGYRGRDVIRLQGRTVVRVFPVYRPRDAFTNPTGGRRRLHFDFANNRWVGGSPERIQPGRFAQVQTNRSTALTVVLHDDGRGEMIVETARPNLSVATFRGTWVVVGNSVRLTLTDRDGQPIRQTILFQIGERGDVMYIGTEGRRVTLRRTL